MLHLHSLNSCPLFIILVFNVEMFAEEDLIAQMKDICSAVQEQTATLKELTNSITGLIAMKQAEMAYVFTLSTSANIVHRFLDMKLQCTHFQHKLHTGNTHH